MDEIRANVRRLTVALYGGEEAPDEPGLIHRMKHIEQATSEIRATVNRVGWIVVGAVLLAVIGLLTKGHP